MGQWVREEWRGSGGERRGSGRVPLSRGECGRCGQQERERQGLPRPSGPGFAGYTAKNRRDDVQRSADRFVIGYFSNVKQVMREGEKMLTSPVHARITSCPHILPIVQLSRQRNQTLLPGFWTVPYLVIGIILGKRGLQSCATASPLGGVWCCLWSCLFFSSNVHSDLKNFHEPELNFAMISCCDISRTQWNNLDTHALNH